MSTEYCRHIRPNGTRCRSYALSGTLRCFWHNSLRQRHLSLSAPPLDGPLECDAPACQQPLKLDFPELEDRSSIQLALSMLLGALARNRIDSKRACSLIYGLQVASANVRGLSGHEIYIVRANDTDENGQPIAPDEDPEEIIDEQLFLEDYEADQKRMKEDEFYESKYDEDE